MRNPVQNKREGLRLLVLASAAMALAFAQGCAKRLPAQVPDAGRIEAPSPPAPAAAENEPAPPEPEKPTPGRLVPVQSGRQVGARISTYYLSSGDEIRVSVLGAPDLSRAVRIPPDGHMFFPMVGDIGVDGMSIPELRQIIADKLRTAEEQRIGTGDQVSVRVYRNDDLSITTIVPSSGRVNLPLGGEVELAGLTVEEANQAIAKKLLPYVVKPSVSTTILKTASGLPGRMSDPQVSVEVLAFGGHKILVLGEVENPGVYVNEGGSRLLEIVARAGGPTKDAKLKNVALIRPATETSPARTAVVDLDRAIKNGDLNQNPPVQRGDVIYVPKTAIAKLAQFFEQVYAIVRPFVVIETGIWLGENIEAGARNQTPSPIVFQ
jgi:polysaccharide export outer membrane protein